MLNINAIIRYIVKMFQVKKYECWLTLISSPPLKSLTLPTSLSTPSSAATIVLPPESSLGVGQGKCHIMFGLCVCIFSPFPHKLALVILPAVFHLDNYKRTVKTKQFVHKEYKF